MLKLFGALILTGSSVFAQSNDNLDDILVAEVKANVEKVIASAAKDFEGRVLKINLNSLRCVAAKSKNEKTEPVGTCIATGSLYSSDSDGDVLSISIGEFDEGAEILRSYTVQSVSHEI